MHAADHAVVCARCGKDAGAHFLDQKTTYENASFGNLLCPGNWHSSTTPGKLLSFSRPDRFLLAPENPDEEQHWAEICRACGVDRAHHIGDEQACPNRETHFTGAPQITCFCGHTWPQHCDPNTDTTECMECKCQSFTTT